jgi:hypothetical protein
MIGPCGLVSSSLAKDMEGFTDGPGQEKNLHADRTVRDCLPAYRPDPTSVGGDAFGVLDGPNRTDSIEMTLSRSEYMRGRGIGLAR